MLEFLLEILLTIAAEGAADVALHAMGLPGVDESGRRRGPLGLALLGYLVAGAIWVACPSGCGRAASSRGGPCPASASCSGP
jgi:hypothetical protein